MSTQYTFINHHHTLYTHYYFVFSFIFNNLHKTQVYVNTYSSKFPKVKQQISLMCYWSFMPILTKLTPNFQNKELKFIRSKQIIREYNFISNNVFVRLPIQGESGHFWITLFYVSNPEIFSTPIKISTFTLFLLDPQNKTYMTFLRCYKVFTIPLTSRLPSTVPVADELYVQNLQLELSLIFFRLWNIY